MSALSASLALVFALSSSACGDGSGKSDQDKDLQEQAVQPARDISPQGFKNQAKTSEELRGELKGFSENLIEDLRRSLHASPYGMDPSEVLSSQAALSLDSDFDFNAPEWYEAMQVGDNCRNLRGISDSIFGDLIVGVDSIVNFTGLLNANFGRNPYLRDEIVLEDLSGGDERFAFLMKLHSLSEKREAGASDSIIGAGASGDLLLGYYRFETDLATIDLSDEKSDSIEPDEEALFIKEGNFFTNLAAKSIRLEASGWYDGPQGGSVSSAKSQIVGGELPVLESIIESVDDERTLKYSYRLAKTDAEDELFEIRIEGALEGEDKPKKVAQAYEVQLGAETCVVTKVLAFK